MSDIHRIPQPSGRLQEHVELIAKHEQEFLEKRSHAEKIGDSIASLIGSLYYVAAHIILFAIWLSWNLLSIPELPHFDPFPFPLLDVIFAFEAILVASFILMRQLRMARRAEERDHLMLQILLLTEREITAVVGMDREMAGRMGLHALASDREIHELSQQTSIDEVAQIIKDSLPTES